MSDPDAPRTPEGDVVKCSQFILDEVARVFGGPDVTGYSLEMKPVESRMTAHVEEGRVVGIDMTAGFISVRLVARPSTGPEVVMNATGQSAADAAISVVNVARLANKILQDAAKPPNRDLST